MDTNRSLCFIIVQKYIRAGAEQFGGSSYRVHGDVKNQWFLG